MLYFVELRGVEPHSHDFQSCAYTTSAKVPLKVASRGIEPLLTEPNSVALPLCNEAINRIIIYFFVGMVGLEPTTSILSG